MKGLSHFFRRSPAWEDTVFWSLDLETEGLDPRRHQILSVGMVPVRRGLIRLSEAYASLVRPGGQPTVENGAIGAHHLRPADTADAPDLASILPAVKERIEEGVLLLHHAPIDLGFLRRAFSENGHEWKKPLVVDTVRLLYRSASQERFLGGQNTDPELNLFAARQKFHLPLYPPHDALTDAIATAELFLALRSRLGATRVSQLV